MRIGACTVTFRQNTPARWIALAKEAGLDGLEWGGDFHVPPLDLENAAAVREMTVAAGLKVLSYGSYYRPLAEDIQARLPTPSYGFADVLDTARTLGAATIRLWAGNRSPDTYLQSERKRLAEHYREAADLAAQQGITLAFEYHRGTLTETAESTLAWLEEVGAPNAKTYWQPNPEISHAARLKELELLTGYIANMHVFCWVRNAQNDRDERLPLSAGVSQWGEYIAAARAGGADPDLLLEFVRGDFEKQFYEDAVVLRTLAGRL
ncbi:MAG: sugar phosphate isomerase/epimerase [Oscillospiraceae bacterium]|jgi:sugar phosphate isomerase/epimerase|nr:sugar phosphate isomerase/epimerase [Oscillospiraceae bacterium]